MKIRNLLLIAGLGLSMPLFAQNFKYKTSIDLNGNLDIGAELQLQADDPNGLGVLGLDLDANLLPTFNFGYNYKFEKVETLTYLGFGMKDTEVCSSSLSSSSTTSSSGNNGFNGNHGQGNQGQGQGNQGQGNGPNGNSSNTTTITNTISKNCTDNREIFHEVGLRFVPRINSNIKPLVEFSSRSLGLDGADNAIKFGIMVDF